MLISKLKLTRLMYLSGISYSKFISQYPVLKVPPLITQKAYIRICLSQRRKWIYYASLSPVSRKILNFFEKYLNGRIGPNFPYLTQH